MDDSRPSVDLLVDRTFRRANPLEEHRVGPLEAHPLRWFAAEDEPLTEEADQGLREALNQLDAGEGRSLAEVIPEIQGGAARR